MIIRYSGHPSRRSPRGAWAGFLRLLIALVAAATLLGIVLTDPKSMSSPGTGGGAAVSHTAAPR